MSLSSCVPYADRIHFDSSFSFLYSTSIDQSLCTINSYLPNIFHFHLYSCKLTLCEQYHHSSLLNSLLAYSVLSLFNLLMILNFLNPSMFKGHDTSSSSSIKAVHSDTYFQIEGGGHEAGGSFFI